MISSLAEFFHYNVHDKLLLMQMTSYILIFDSSFFEVFFFLAVARLMYKSSLNSLQTIHLSIFFYSAILHMLTKLRLACLKLLKSELSTKTCCRYI